MDTQRLPRGESGPSIGYSLRAESNAGRLRIVFRGVPEGRTTNRYRRAARTAQELELGTLAPLLEARTDRIEPFQAR